MFVTWVKVPRVYFPSCLCLGCQIYLKNKSIAIHINSECERWCLCVEVMYLPCKYFTPRMHFTDSDITAPANAWWASTGQGKENKCLLLLPELPLHPDRLQSTWELNWTLPPSLALSKYCQSNKKSTRTVQLAELEIRGMRKTVSKRDVNIISLSDEKNGVIYWDRKEQARRGFVYLIF